MNYVHFRKSGYIYVFILLTGCSSYALFDCSTSGINRTSLALKEKKPATCVERQNKSLSYIQWNLYVMVIFGPRFLALVAAYKTSGLVYKFLIWGIFRWP